MTSITSNMYPIKGYALDDVEYYPDLQIIPPKQEREKVAFKTNVQPAPTGIVGSFRNFPAEVVNIQPNDVILLRISDDLDLHTCREIQKEMNETFPNNKTLLCNEHIFKGLTILRGETETISDTVDIKTTIDVDKIFDVILKGHPNDFLY